jgi:hypothetical protein
MQVVHDGQKYEVPNKTVPNRADVFLLCAQNVLHSDYQSLTHNIYIAKTTSNMLKQAWKTVNGCRLNYKLMMIDDSFPVGLQLF